MDRLVTAETLAAALPDDLIDPDGQLSALAIRGYKTEAAVRILAAIPPDPRLDALLAAAREVLNADEDDDAPLWQHDEAIGSLRDALAAFEEQV